MRFAVAPDPIGNQKNAFAAHPVQQSTAMRCGKEKRFRERLAEPGKDGGQTRSGIAAVLRRF
jgi:hypothetical protein